MLNLKLTDYRNYALNRPPLLTKETRPQRLRHCEVGRGVGGEVYYGFVSR
jgi:hypothetical protein